MFKEYTHIEKYGRREVEGIDQGKCYIFPKIDGTNGSVWADTEDDIYREPQIVAGSRKRQLTLENDNAGFFNSMKEDPNIVRFLQDLPHLRLFGEWLVPHTLKTYTKDAWRKFYIFDVYNDDLGLYTSYPTYIEILDKYNLEYIKHLAVIENPTYDDLTKLIDDNHYLIKEGEGVGEGIVIKNYRFTNRYGRHPYAKIVTKDFKEVHRSKVKTQREIPMTEQAICDKYVTESLIDKVHANIINECDGWSSKYIARLLQTVYYDLIREESWNFIKEHKNPTINFRTLNSVCNATIKELKPEIFG